MKITLLIGSGSSGGGGGGDGMWWAHKIALDGSALTQSVGGGSFVR